MGDIYLATDYPQVYGDGVHDDTAGIQAALNTGANRVFGWDGATFLISNSTGQTKLIDGVQQPYCLSIPSNVIFDLAGATLQLAASQNTSMIVLGGDDNNVTGNAALRNGFVDNNSANQSWPNSSVNPAIYFGNGTGIVADNITVLNAADKAGCFVNCRESQFTNLKCLGSLGAGWYFGSSDTGMSLYHCFIDNIYAERCQGTKNPAVIAGNPTVFGVTNTTAGKCIARNCGGGHKIQNNCLQSTFDQFVFDGSPVGTEGPYGTGDSGTKIQGNGSLQSQFITINSVISSNCFATGLYVEDCLYCTVGKYTGNNNATGNANEGDVWLDGTGNRIDDIRSAGCQDPNQAVGVQSNAADCSIGNIYVLNCKGAALNIQCSGDFNVGDITALDTAGNMSYAVEFVQATLRGRTGVIKVSPPNSTYTYRINPAPGAVDFFFGPVIMSSDPIVGQVTLTKNAIQTTVANGNCQKITAGANYCYPIILFNPINTPARALGTVTPQFPTAGSGTGFTLHHPNPGKTSASFAYVIMGYATLPVQWS